MPRPVRLFLSYADRDRELLDQLQTHLSLLRRQKLVEPWDERPLLASQPYQGEIDPNLERADIVLLLVTPSFLSSSYCYEGELMRAMELHEQGLVRVIPILCRPADLTGAAFSKLQGLPSGGKAITMWHNADEAWLNVVQGLRQVVQVMKERPERKAGAEAQTGARAAAPPGIERKADPNQIYEQLEQLMPVQFEKVLFYSQVPLNNLPPSTAPQTVRAIDLIRFFQGQGERGLADLATAIQRTLKTSR